jgi:DNA-binding FadR family transcriptional regulator
LVSIGLSGYHGRVMTTVEGALRGLLRDGLQDGTLAPGAKLPTERALVERFAAPRSAVRKALESLESEGVLVREVGRGTFLTDAAAAPEATAPADTSPAEIMQLRLLLEPPVAALAARVATRADLERITGFLERGGRSGEFQDFETADALLHRAIAQAAHNGLLMNVFEVLNAARTLPVWGSLKRRTSTPERMHCYHAEHTAIVDALSDRDPDSAERAMRTHLQHVADTLLGRA